MSMTGGFSFFEKSKNLFMDGATATASSNAANAKLAIGSDKYLKWSSTGSDDTTTETITITLPASASMSRIFLMSHNFKDFSVKYGSGGANHFSNVVGLDGANATGIVETVNNRIVNYYEFDAVSTDTIVITATKTHVVDAQKELTELITTNEIGTLVGFPDVRGIEIDRSVNEQKAITGRSIIEKQYEVVSLDMRLRSYPNQADIDLLDNLHNRSEPFLVWPCGGIPENFKYQSRGWRVQDLFQMKANRRLLNGYEKNVYKLGVDQIYSFAEVSQ